MIKLYASLDTSLIAFKVSGSVSSESSALSLILRQVQPLWDFGEKSGWHFYYEEKTIQTIKS